MEYLSIDVSGNSLLAHLNGEIAECREHLLNWRNVENKLILEIAETKNTARELINVLYNENRRNILVPLLHRLADYLELYEHKQYYFQRVSGVIRSFIERITVLQAAVEEEEDRLFDLAEVHYVSVSGNRAPSA